MKMESMLFDDQVAADFTREEQERLYQALQAAFSPNADHRLIGIKQIGSIDGHRRSPLAASALAHRLHEPNTEVLAEVVNLIASIFSDPPSMDSGQIPRRWAAQTLRQLGRRELVNLLGLIQMDHAWFDRVALILNECSLAGEMLVDIFTDGTRELEQRLAAIELIDQVGFMEAVPMIEHWIHRLASRQERQLRMSFAPAPDIEAEAILPALRQTLGSLGGSTQG
jgi:hypothetical protein